MSFPVVPDELRSLAPSDFTLLTAPLHLPRLGPKRWAEAAASDRHQRLPASLLRS